MSVSLDVHRFTSRVNEIQKFIEKKSLDHLIVALGPTIDSEEKNLRDSYSEAIFHWLLGYEFPDTALVVGKNGVSFLSSSKKISILSQLEKSSIAVKLHARTKGNENDGFKILISGLGLDSSSLVTSFLRSPERGFCNDLTKFMADHNIDLNRIAVDISELWAVKDKMELDYIGYASIYCEGILNDFNQVIRKNFNISQASAQKSLLSNLETVSKKLSEVLPKGESVDYFEVGNLDIRKLDDIWSIDVTCKYKSYNSSFARIFYSSQAPEDVKNGLSDAYDARNYMLKNIKSGQNSADVHQKFKNYISSLQNASIFNCGSIGHSVLYFFDV